MNLGSEKKLSMDELMARNRPTQAVPKPIPPPEVHPTQEEWSEMLDYLDSLNRHMEIQTSYLKRLTELIAQHPTRTQMEEMLKRTAHLEQMVEQAGSRKEKSFSLPKIKLPSLCLPELDGPTWAFLLMFLAALFLLWWCWGNVWTSLSQMLP